ncbi:MAG: hypothetical protein IT204_23090 [Fimbriimonadaceae bacterium]|nr:hypothetical protein [Fimbriimonadaceae bacterium]
MSRGLGWPVLLVMLAAWLQTTWLPSLPLGGEWPDLVLVVIVLTALAGGLDAGLAAALSGGLLLALAAPAGGLAFVLSRLLTALWLVSLRNRWSRDNLVVQVVAVMLGTLACELAFAALRPAVLQHADWATRVGCRVLLNAPLAPFVSWAVARLPIEEDGLAR